MFLLLYALASQVLALISGGACISVHGNTGSDYLPRVPIDRWLSNLPLRHLLTPHGLTPRPFAQTSKHCLVSSVLCPFFSWLRVRSCRLVCHLLRLQWKRIC